MASHTRLFAEGLNKSAGYLIFVHITSEVAIPPDLS
jgi:hypothetical protein